MVTMTTNVNRKQPKSSKSMPSWHTQFFLVSHWLLFQFLMKLGTLHSVTNRISANRMQGMSTNTNSTCSAMILRTFHWVFFAWLSSLIKKGALHVMIVTVKRIRQTKSIKMSINSGKTSNLQRFHFLPSCFNFFTDLANNGARHVSITSTPVSMQGISTRSCRNCIMQIFLQPKSCHL